MEQGFGDGQPDFGVCALSPNNMPQDQTAIPCPSCVEATPQAEHVGGEVNWGPGSGEETLPREPSAGGHSAHPVSPPCWLPTTVGGDMTPEAQPPEVSPRRAEARTRVSGGC